MSDKDKELAEKAIEELQTASTYDLTCCLCDPEKTFTAYSSLLTHLRSHAGQRPFKCDQCQATFTRQHSLKYHLLVHKGKSWFTCPHYNRQFRHPTHFKERVAKHGDDAKLMVEIERNEELLQTNKICAGEILAKVEKKLEGKGKMKSDLDEKPDQSLSLSLKTEPDSGPGQTLAQVLDSSGGIETGTVVYLTPRHPDYR